MVKKMMLFIFFVAQFVMPQQLENDKKFSIEDQNKIIFTLNGTWWRKLSYNEQEAYIIGFLVAMQNTYLINSSIISLAKEKAQNTNNEFVLKSLRDISNLLSEYNKRLENRYYIQDIIDYLNDYYAHWPIKNEPVVVVLSEILYLKKR